MKVCFFEAYVDCECDVHLGLTDTIFLTGDMVAIIDYNLFSDVSRDFSDLVLAHLNMAQAIFPIWLKDCHDTLPNP